MGYVGDARAPERVTTGSFQEQADIPWGGRANRMAVTKATPRSMSSSRTTAAKAKTVKGADARFQQARRASILLKHVSDPTRLQVILILSEGERHVGALCAQLSQSQPAVSHHLALLRHGGIIAPRRQGKNNFYSLTDTGSDLARVVKNLIA
jgi:DNA-binding transcriptional ArsR family regulator